MNASPRAARPEWLAFDEVELLRREVEARFGRRGPASRGWVREGLRAASPQPATDSRRGRSDHTEGGSGSPG